MRALFVTWAWPSHFYPLVQLAWATRAAGHEVRVASQPGLTEVITQAGLTAAPVGEDVDVLRVMRPFFAWVAEQGRPVEWAELAPKGAATVRLYVALADAMVDDTIALTRSWRPDVIVHEATSFAGPLAAAVTGTPAVRHIHGVDFPYQSHEFEPAALARICDRLGLDTVETLGAATVDPCPPSMQVPADIRRLRMRYSPYNGPAVLPRWLRNPPAGRRICVTWGTSTSTLTGDQMFLPPRVIAAAAGLDAEIVVSLTARDVATLGKVAANVRVVESVPLHLLLPTCDAVVHQGGNGTILTAALLGVPQLVLPQLPDQLFYCAKLAETGAAAVLRVGEETDEALRSQLAAIMSDPAYRQAAARLRAEMLDQPPAARAVAALAELAACHPVAGHQRQGVT
ncbi:MAG TPA: nucleotide disphospho-sugar-binding domain-containing protein [Streptosporangiaceae bacterium]|nr:nucleotide disphospho-sugar-binding domain-containing protein [Streptosporangiaceae bacterium]